MLKEVSSSDDEPQLHMTAEDHMQRVRAAYDANVARYKSDICTIHFTDQLSMSRTSISIRAKTALHTHESCILYKSVFPFLQTVQVVPGELELDEGASASIACSRSVPS